MKLFKTVLLASLVASATFTTGVAVAQEAAIRKNLAERLQSFSKIDEISKTPMNGLYEVRVNNRRFSTPMPKATFCSRAA